MKDRRRWAGASSAPHAATSGTSTPASRRRAIALDLGPRVEDREPEGGERAERLSEADAAMDLREEDLALHLESRRAAVRQLTEGLAAGLLDPSEGVLTAPEPVEGRGRP